MDPRDEALVPYLLRAVRAAVWSHLLTVAALIVYLVLPGEPHPNSIGILATLLGIALVGALIMARLPWARLFQSKAGSRILALWVLVDVVLITAGIAFTGAGRSPLFLLYALTTVFIAITTRTGIWLSVLGLTYLSYLAVLVVAGWNITPAALAIDVLGLGLVAFLAHFLSMELSHLTIRTAEARSEADRRAALLRTVASAARTVSALESEAVLRAVVEAVTVLRFEAANLALFDESGGTYRVGFAIGLPAEYESEDHPIDGGLPGLVRKRRRTVTLDDYTSHAEAVPSLRVLGIREAVASPVWVQGRLAGALVGGSAAGRPITDQDVEAFDLLAALAGRALENARVFEDERRTVERMAELDRLKSDFISTVSHELRTPLTAITGMGATMEQKWDVLDDDLRKELLRRLNANARALDHIIGTLLDFSRFEAGRLEVHLEPVEVGGIVEEVARRLEGLFEDHPLDLSLDGQPVVRGDPLLLERVIENLMSNAVKHTPPGTPVHVVTSTSSDEVRVEVRDEGPGISREDIQFLGERFYRGSTTTSRGTGLGLALVREILRMHGTALEVDSAPGSGATFSFRLPVTTPAPVSERP